MKTSAMKLVLAVILAGLVMSHSDLQASGGKTTLRVTIRVSRSWLSFGHIAVRKVTIQWTASGGRMDGLFSGGNSNSFDTDNFEAGLVRYSPTSATFYEGRYRDFGIGGSGYPMKCTIEFDVVTYNSNKQAVIKSSGLTRSVTINGGTNFLFEWSNTM